MKLQCYQPIIKTTVYWPPQSSGVARHTFTTTHCVVQRGHAGIDQRIQVVCGYWRLRQHPPGRNLLTLENVDHSDHSGAPLEGREGRSDGGQAFVLPFLQEVLLILTNHDGDVEAGIFKGFDSGYSGSASIHPDGIDLTEAVKVIFHDGLGAGIVTLGELYTDHGDLRVVLENDFGRGPAVFQARLHRAKCGRRVRCRHPANCQR